MGSVPMKRLMKPLLAALLFSLVLTGCASHDLALSREDAYRAYQDGDYSTAVVQFEMLAREMPGDAELWFRLGNAYAKAMMPEQAVAAYRNSLLRDPQLSKAWYNMGVIQMQTALKSFLDMQDYVSADDPVGVRGLGMRDGLLTLLGQDDTGEK
jgi:tetratricopeptide (TPR) repeat protein